MRFTGFSYSEQVGLVGDAFLVSPKQNQKAGRSDRTELREFDPGLILEGSVVAHDYADHVPRSRSPGVDIDVTYDVDSLPRNERPDVHSPVDGTLEFVGGRDGTIKVRDRNGFIHIMFHNDINSGIKAGDTIAKGDIVGKESNIHGKKTISAHVHYSVYDPKTQQYLDPQALSYDETGAVDPESARRENERQTADKLDRMSRDPNLGEKGIKFDSTDPPDKYGNVA